MKRIKARFSDLIDLDIEYHAFQRVKRCDGVTGTRFVLSKPLSDTQRKKLSAFRNIVFSSCAHKYAPEIRYETLIILDKVLQS